MGRNFQYSSVFSVGNWIVCPSRSIFLHWKRSLSCVSLLTSVIGLLKASHTSLSYNLLILSPSFFPIHLSFQDALPHPSPLSNEQNTSLRAHFLVFQETGSKLLTRQIRCFVSSLKSENRWLSIWKGKLHIASFSFTGPASRFLNHILQLKLTECVTGLNWIRQL